jgi:hypothetical protein
MRVRVISISALVLLVLGAVFFGLVIGSARSVEAAPEVFASPVHAGCYIAAVNDCRIHVEPLAINVNSGSKIAYFQLVAIQIGPGTHTVIYDWKPDLSNGLPITGTVVYPSQVAQDFGAGCGKIYQISLQGRDSLDPNVYNLGLTGQFTCPAALP